MNPALWLLPALPFLLLTTILWRGVHADATGWRHALPLASTPGAVVTVVLAAATVPTLLVLAATALLRPYLSPADLPSLRVLDGLVVPVVEELGKVFALAVLATRNRPMTPRDGLMLGLLAGVAFATVETYGHLWAARAAGGATAMGDVLQVRLLLPAALHGCVSGLFGFALTGGLRRTLAAVWIVLAIALHSAWNLSLMGMEASAPHPLHLLVLALPLAGALAWAALWVRTGDHRPPGARRPPHRPRGPSPAPRGQSEADPDDRSTTAPR